MLSAMNDAHVTSQRFACTHYLFVPFASCELSLPSHAYYICCILLYCVLTTLHSHSLSSTSTSSMLVGIIMSLLLALCLNMSSFLSVCVLHCRLNMALLLLLQDELVSLATSEHARIDAENEPSDKGQGKLSSCVALNTYKLLMHHTFSVLTLVVGHHEQHLQAMGVRRGVKGSNPPPIALTWKFFPCQKLQRNWL